jgi:hypothetical protein
MAALILKHAGIDAANLGRGYRTWRLFHPD